ncbi:MAG TPA: hypothetical protein VIL26_02785 [Clostridia bacterium]
MKRKLILCLLLSVVFLSFFGCDDESNWRNHSEMHFGKNTEITGTPIMTLENTIVSFDFNDINVYEYTKEGEDYSFKHTEYNDYPYYSFYPIKFEKLDDKYIFFGTLSQYVEGQHIYYAAVLFLNLDYTCINYKVIDNGTVLSVNYKDNHYYFLYQYEGGYSLTKTNNNYEIVLEKEFESATLHKTKNIYFINDYVAVELEGDRIIIYDENFEEVLVIKGGMIFLEANEQDNTFSCLTKKYKKRTLTIFYRTYNINGEILEEKNLGQFKGIFGNPIYYKQKDKLYFFEIAGLDQIGISKTLVLAVFDLNDFSHKKYFMNWHSTLPQQCLFIDNKIIFCDGTCEELILS